MGQWILCRETPPGSGNFPSVDFLAASPDAGGGVAWLQDGKAIFEDGFPNDFSGWGDDESNVIMNFLWKLSAADSGISYACYWVGPDFVPNQGGGEGLMAAQRQSAAVQPPVFIMMQSSKLHKKPKKPKK